MAIENPPCGGLGVITVWRMVLLTSQELLQFVALHFDMGALRA